MESAGTFNINVSALHLWKSTSLVVLSLFIPVVLTAEVRSTLDLFQRVDYVLYMIIVTEHTFANINMIKDITIHG